MPTRSTPNDETFKRMVAKEFIRARNRALKNGFSMEDFVGKLGITRAAFHKHVHRKAIPSLRVLANARKYWGVQLSYHDLGDAFVKAKKKNTRQTEFLFSVAAIAIEKIEVHRVTPKGVKAVE